MSVNKTIKALREERDGLYAEIRRLQAAAGEQPTIQQMAREARGLASMRDRMAARDVLLTRMKALFRVDDPFDLYDAVCAALAGNEPVGQLQADLVFEFHHSVTQKRQCVTVTRAEVAEHMDDVLFEKLTDKLCQCETVGETNVLDCCCDELAEKFKLVQQEPPAASCKPEAQTALAQAVNNAGKVAHLYKTGAGLLAWIHSERDAIAAKENEA